MPGLPGMGGGVEEHISVLLTSPSVLGTKCARFLRIRLSDDTETLFPVADPLVTMDLLFKSALT